MSRVVDQNTVLKNKKTNKKKPNYLWPDGKSKFEEKAAREL